MTGTDPIEDVEVEIPTYCGADEDEVERRKPNVVAMMEALEDVEPLEDGYRFVFGGDDETLARVTTFLRNERRCCPMADFELTCSGKEEPITLTMRGPEGMQADIREGMQLDRFLEEAG
jgi:hypothetical protein